MSKTTSNKKVSVATKAKALTTKAVLTVHMPKATALALGKGALAIESKANAEMQTLNATKGAQYDAMMRKVSEYLAKDDYDEWMYRRSLIAKGAGFDDATEFSKSGIYKGMRDAAKRIGFHFPKRGATDDEKADRERAFATKGRMLRKIKQELCKVQPSLKGAKQKDTLEIKAAEVYAAQQQAKSAEGKQEKARTAMKATIEKIIEKVKSGDLGDNVEGQKEVCLFLANAIAVLPDLQ